MIRRTFLSGGAALGWPGAAMAGPLAGTLGVAPANAAAPPGRGRWLTKEPLPLARAEVGVATVNGKVYVLGGYAGGRVDQPFNQEYDAASNTWRDRAPMPRGLNHVAPVGFNDRVYAFGGFIEQNRNAVADANEGPPLAVGSSRPSSMGGSSFLAASGQAVYFRRTRCTIRTRTGGRP